MASRSVSALKFVGTVSLGLLTGLSYTLTTLTVPALLTLPSAASASRAFRSLSTTATTQLRALTGLSSAAFLLAFFLSPRPFRHPYLLYTSILALGSSVISSDKVAPLFLRVGPAPGTAPKGGDGVYPLKTSTTTTKASKKKAERRVERRMEASYEVLGSSDAHSEGGTSGSGEELEDDVPAQTQAQQQQEEEQRNGEEVRSQVETFLKKQVVQTAVAGVGFLMAVVGIWGDGAMQVFQSETLIVEV